MVQVRTVIPIALLAIVHKVMILDLASTEALQLFALAAAVLALGATHRLVPECLHHQRACGQRRCR
jgi:uncharacterized membrane protein (DUF373 family)